MNEKDRSIPSEKFAEYKDLHSRFVAALSNAAALDSIFSQNTKYLHYLQKAQLRGTWKETQSSCFETLSKIAPQAKNFLTPSYRAQTPDTKLPRPKF